MSGRSCRPTLLLPWMLRCDGVLCYVTIIAAMCGKGNSPFGALPQDVGFRKTVCFPSPPQADANANSLGLPGPPTVLLPPPTHSLDAGSRREPLCLCLATPSQQPVTPDRNSQIILHPDDPLDRGAVRTEHGVLDGQLAGLAWMYEAEAVEAVLWPPCQRTLACRCWGCLSLRSLTRAPCRRAGLRLGWSRPWLAVRWSHWRRSSRPRPVQPRPGRPRAGQPR